MNDQIQLKPREVLRSGSTVVEAAVAAMLLVIVVLGTGAYLQHGAAQVGIQRDRAAALEAAESRLEAVIAAGYGVIAPASETYSVRYLRKQGSGWTVSASDPGEAVTINGRSFPIRTTVQYVDIDSGTSFDDSTATYDGLNIAVSVGYRVNSSDGVTLETFLAN